MGNQKEYEELSRQMNRVEGATAYYKELCGKYRELGHKVTRKMKFYKKLCLVFAGSLVVVIIATVVIVGMRL